MSIHDLFPQQETLPDQYQRIRAESIARRAAAMAGPGLPSGGGGLFDISAPFDALYDIIAGGAEMVMTVPRVAGEALTRNLETEVVEPFAKWSQTNREWFFGVGGGLMGFVMGWTLTPLAWQWQLAIPSLIAARSAGNRNAQSFGLGFGIGQTAQAAIRAGLHFYRQPLRTAAAIAGALTGSSVGGGWGYRVGGVQGAIIGALFGATFGAVAVTGVDRQFGIFYTGAVQGY